MRERERERERGRERGRGRRGVGVAARRRSVRGMRAQTSRSRLLQLLQRRERSHLGRARKCVYYY